MFTRTSLISRQPKTSAFKYMTMFFLGASAVMLATQALQINTMVTNSVQYIGKTIMTAGGANAGPETIILDGSGGNAFFSGNVGIGITGSLYKFYLMSHQSVSTYNPDFVLNNAAGGFIGMYGNTYGKTKIEFIGSGLGDPLEIYQDATGTAYIMNTTSRNLYIGTDITHDITISGHNVGIGTDTPGKALEVSGDIKLTTSGSLTA